MPNLSGNEIVMIVIALVFLGGLIIMGPRLKNFDFSFGIFKGKANAGTAGAHVDKNVVDGDRNKATALGQNASITENKIKGNDNEFTANSGGS